MYASGQILPGWMTLTFARDDSAVAAGLEVIPGRWSFWRLYSHLVGRDLILKLGW